MSVVTTATTATIATPAKTKPTVTCACGTILSGRADTFGLPGDAPCCASCWLREADHDRKTRTYFDTGDMGMLNSYVNEAMDFDPLTHFLPSPLDAFCAAADASLMGDESVAVCEARA